MASTPSPAYKVDDLDIPFSLDDYDPEYFQRQREMRDSISRQAEIQAKLHGQDFDDCNSDLSTSIEDFGKSYEYQPLEPNTIRLLRLLPIPERLCCSIRHVELKNAPSFKALSYTWSDQSSPETILYVETFSKKGPKLVQELAIGSNCASALESLRPATVQSTSFLPGIVYDLWVDAICIDQNNVEERNQQVRLMAQVFSCAQQVQVYLGDGQSEEIEDEARRQMKLANALREPSTSVKRYLLGLTQRRWFWRAWTLQEISLAKRAMLFYGNSDHVLDWGELQRLIWLHFKDVAPAPIFDLLQQHDPKALELLHITRECGAKEPKDKIYALQALMPEIERIPVDYSLTKDEAYVAFALNQINQDRGLDMLSLAQGTAGSPSWVPYWDKPVKQHVLRFRSQNTRYHAGTKLPSGEHGEPVYRQDVRIDSVDSTKVSLRVYVVEKLLYLGAAFHREDTATATATRWRDVLQDWDLLDHKAHRTETAFTPNPESLHSLDRTVSANDVMNTNVDEDGHVSTADCAHHRYWSWRCAAASRDTALKGQDESWGKVIVDFHEKASSVCDGRRLFRQNNGRFGLAPAEAQVGDVVCIPLGGRIPFVIREPRVSDSKLEYILVGECYLDGWMYGEVFPESGERDAEGYRIPVDGVHLEDITLC